MTRKTLATSVAAGVIVCTLILACTASTPVPAAGLTPTTDAGMAGCAPLQEGCFAASGTYATPVTSPACSAPGKPAAGAADSHCAGAPPHPVSAASCNIADAGPAPSDDAGSGEGGAPSEAGTGPAPGACGENGPGYGSTMYGTEGGDDDCKYQLSYTVTPLCENDGAYFTVTATHQTSGSPPLTGACAFAELCLSDTHPAPAIDYRPPTGKQQVVEGPPGTYTIGPVQFDHPGKWTVRFHFDALCCDVAHDSPHGHAAFFVDVP